MAGAAAYDGSRTGTRGSSCATRSRAKPGHPTQLGGLLRELLGELLGEGTGPCLEIGCGTDLLNAVLDAGLTVDRLAEHGDPTPTILALRATRPAAGGRLTR